MFEFGRELRRLLSGEPATGPQDGLTGGDATLLELLDLHLLTNEARGADIAAGRIGSRDRPARLLHAAACWREVTRRTGIGRQASRGERPMPRPVPTHAPMHADVRAPAPRPSGIPAWIWVVVALIVLYVLASAR